MMNRKRIASLAVIPTLVLGATSHAATISGSFSGVTDDTRTAVDLTVLGSTDWQIWDYSGTANITSVPLPNVFYNDKVGGSAIGDLEATIVFNPGTPTPANGVVIANLNPDHTFSYTDGSEPGLTSEVETGLLGLGLRGQAAGVNDQGNSLSFTVTPQSLEEHTVTVFGMLRRTGTQITAEIGGVIDVVSVDAVINTNEDWVYTATFTPDSLTDVATFTLTGNGTTLAGQENSFFNAYRVNAVAVSVVPEPSSLGLIGLGLAALVGRRRRVA